MNISNRQIKTGHTVDNSFIILVAKKTGKFNGKSFEIGQTIKCTRSEARRILCIDKSMFEIKLDQIFKHMILYLQVIMIFAIKSSAQKWQL